MFLGLLGRFCLFVSLATVVAGLDYLSEAHLNAFSDIFTLGLTTKKDLSTVHHSVAGLTVLGRKVSGDSHVICKFAQDTADEGDVESLYHATSLAGLLGCSVKFAKAGETVKAMLTDPKATAQKLYFAATVANNLKLPVDTTALDTALTAAIKADDSANSLSYALQAASEFLKTDSLTAYFNRIEDMIGQADDIDGGKYLQFDGGLSITAFAVSSIYKLAAKIGKTPSIKADEAVKFASYFINRKSVKQERAAHLLLEVVTLFTTNKFHLPVSVTLASPVAVSSAAPKVRARVCNLLGKSLGEISVTVDSATHVASSGVIMNKKPMGKVAEDKTNTEYELVFVDSKRDKGFYVLAVSVASQKDKRLIGTQGAELNVKVMMDIVIDQVELAVFDREQVAPASMPKVAFGKKLETALSGDNHNKMAMKFKIGEKGGKAAIKVHQAFVIFVHKKTGQELVFVAEPDNTMVYNFDMDLQKSTKDFDHTSGVYKIRLVAGDAVATNAIDWHFADIDLNFPAKPVTTESSVDKIVYHKLPEIKHMFNVPDKRPPQLISDVFTVACLVPFLLMLVLWLRIGVNISNVTPSLYTLGYHLGLIGIVGLYFMFWLQLNMFTTLKYLSIVGGFTFLCGNRMLRAMAERRKTKTE